MAHQCEVPGRPSDEGTDQGTEQAGSQELRPVEVSDSGDQPRRYQAGTDLDPAADYRISGSVLNRHYDFGVRKFNDAQQHRTPDTFPYSYATGFWNGYAAAAANIRDEIRRAVISPEV